MSKQDSGLILPLTDCWLRVVLIRLFVRSTLVMIIIRIIILKTELVLSISKAVYHILMIFITAQMDTIAKILWELPQKPTYSTAIARTINIVIK